ncbi:MAG: hypothetical protein WC508_00845 [Patescibacteria group bacterium]
MSTAKAKPIKIYLISRISSDAHKWNEKVCKNLVNENIDVFIPHLHNEWNIAHEKISYAIVRTDVDQMKNAHFGLLLVPYGRDCAWEAGWFSHSNKILISFVHKNVSWLRDWMLKGGLDYIITDSKKTYRILQQDPVLNIRSIILLKSINNLHEVIEKIYTDEYVKKRRKKPLMSKG